MKVKEFLETYPHNYHWSHVQIWSDLRKFGGNYKRLDCIDINRDLPNSKQDLFNRIIEKYGECEVKSATDKASNFCVYVTEIELKAKEEWSLR